MNEEKHPDIELTHFCAIHLHAKVDTTIKYEKKRQSSGASYNFNIWQYWKE